MQPSPDYPMFACVCALGIIGFLSCVSAYFANVRAFNAMQHANCAHLRLDRMQKSAKLTDRETLAVSYSQGFHLRDSWEDDFHRTQLVHKQFKPSRFKRLIRWMLY